MRIAPERRDIVSYPLEGSDLIEQAEITRRLSP
jgi:hypothetical protein